MASLVSGEPLRLLLVSPRAERREQVGDALQAAGEHRFYWVSQPDLAFGRAQDLSPHVILVDADLGAEEGEPARSGADPVALIRQLSGALPSGILLLLVEPDRLAVAQLAVLAGARAFVPLPVRGDELLSVLRQVLGFRAVVSAPTAVPPPAGNAVVFCGPKGGTGRTTLAINTAIALHETARQPVAIVDADYAAPALDVALNLQNQRDIRDLLPKLGQLDADLLLSVLATHSTGVRILLAPPPEALDAPPTLPQVQRVVAWLKRVFSWVVVDLGLPLDESSFAFLDASDIVVVSILPDMIGMRNARLMLAQLDQRNYPPGKVWPLLNRDGLHGGVPFREVERYLRQPLRFSIPNDQELATETINRGEPVVVSHRRRPLAQAYRRLAAELIAARAGAASAETPDETGEAAEVSARIRSAVTIGGRRPSMAVAGASAALASAGVITSRADLAAVPARGRAVQVDGSGVQAARARRTKQAGLAVLLMAVLAAIIVPLIFLLAR